MFAAAMLGLMIVPIAFIGFEPPDGVRSVDSLVPIGNPESWASGNPPQFHATPPDNTLGDAGVPIGFVVVVQDIDDDTLNVTWDWGDGVIETNLTPPAASPQIVRRNHTYNPTPLPGQEGTATYILNTSLDDGNGNMVWDLTTVNVTRPHNLPPTIISVLVTHSGLPGQVNPGDEVTMVANASDPEGDPLTWTYVFNDSVSDYMTAVNYTPQSEPGAIVWSNISTVFDVVGEYRVTVNVSDAPTPYQIWPHNVSEYVDIRVVEDTPPWVTGIISVVPDSPILDLTIGYVVVYYQIETRDPDGDILTATWDFGDGSPVELNVSSGGDRICTFSQSRNYTGEGSFNISVTVTDGRLGHDVTRNVTVTIQVLDHSPESSFTVDPLTGDSSTDFVFNASSSSDIETPTDDLMVRWDFDNDGTWDTDWSTWKLTNHTFSAPGTYTIVLEVKDASGLTNTTTLDVVVTEAIPEFDGITTAILLLALVLVLCIWRIPSRTR